MPQAQIPNAQEHRLDEDIQLPDIMREPYKGPSESMTALTRGTILGIPAYFLGKMIGNSAESTRPGKYVGLRAGGFSAAMGAAAFLLGVTSASREVNENKRQIGKLKRTVEKIHDQNVALKHELREQLDGKGTLTHFKNEWTESDPDEYVEAAKSVVATSAPDSNVQAAQAKHEGAAKPAATQGVSHA